MSYPKDWLQTSGGWCAGRNTRAERVANRQRVGVDAKNGLEIDGDTFVPARDGAVKQSQRMADVAVIVRWRRRGGGRWRKTMRRVVVMDQNDVAVAIVPADVTPLDGAAAHQQRKQRSDAAAYETITNEAESHPLEL